MTRLCDSAAWVRARVEPMVECAKCGNPTGKPRGVFVPSGWTERRVDENGVARDYRRGDYQAWCGICAPADARVFSVPVAIDKFGARVYDPCAKVGGV